MASICVVLANAPTIAALVRQTVDARPQTAKQPRQIPKVIQQKQQSPND